MLPTRCALTCTLATFAAFAAQPVAAQGEDICFPEEFFAVNAIYFPFETDTVVNNHWFSLPAQRELVESFPNDTEVVSFIDAYDLGRRYTLLGTHTNQQNISYDQCFVSEIQEPVQEPVCFAQGASRRASFSLAHSPLNNSIVADSQAPDFVRVDALWTQIGSVSVPMRLVERTDGRPFLLIEFRNVRLEVDPSVFDIPAICDGVPVSSASSPPHRALFGESTWEQMRRLPQFRRLDPSL